MKSKGKKLNPASLHIYQVYTNKEFDKNFFLDTSKKNLLNIFLLGCYLGFYKKDFGKYVIVTNIYLLWHHQEH